LGEAIPGIGCISPAAILSKVDLPEPFAANQADPITGRNSELRTRKQGSMPRAPR
jgi:hypothetical protein